MVLLKYSTIYFIISTSMTEALLEPSPEIIPPRVDLEIESEKAEEKFSQTLEQGRREDKPNLIASSAAMLKLMDAPSPLSRSDREKMTSRLQELRSAIEKGSADEITQVGHQNRFRDLIFSMAVIGEKPQLKPQEIATLQKEYEREMKPQAAATMNLLQLPFPKDESGYGSNYGENKYAGKYSGPDRASKFNQEFSRGSCTVQDLERAAFTKLAGSPIKLSDVARENIIKSLSSDREYIAKGIISETDIAKKIAYLKYLES